MARFVALDRDGTIIEERPYLSDPSQVRLLPNAVAGLRALRDAGLSLALVTNQSGVGRGYFGLDAVTRVNETVTAMLAEHGVAIDQVLVCPHAPNDGCRCRKPETGMLAMAAAAFGASPRQASVIGDKWSDIEMGRRAGAATILVRTGWGLQTESERRTTPDYVAADLLEASQFMLAGASQSGRHDAREVSP